MKFSVWAPHATSMSVVTGGHDFPMFQKPRGWWESEIEAVEGQLYGFRPDNGPCFPDPRTSWQPEGVHGPSCVVDTSKFRNENGDRDRNREGGIFKAPPLSRAVIYELHIGTFSPEGTYAGAERRLAHLVDLGVTHLEIMPLAACPGTRGWSYDGVHLYAPFPAYGTPRELADFVAACHAHGLAVVLDVVYNHLGPDGNYLPKFGPYFTQKVATPWGEAMNLDGPWSDGVRAFIIDNALMWLRDYGFDGLRLDAVHALHDTRALHILEELAERVRELGETENRPLVLIAESDLNDPRLVRPAGLGGYGLDAHWADELHHAIHVFLTGEKEGYYADYQGLEDLGQTLAEGYLHQGRYSAARQRSHGRPPAGVRPDQLIVCSQNHDQIGNRARGERLSMLLPAEKLKAAAALVLLSPYVPMLFQGEEWAAMTPFLFFSDHESEALRTKISESRYEEFKAFSWAENVPDPSDPQTFHRSLLDWNEPLLPHHQEMLHWYRELIRLRKARPRNPAKASVRWDTRQLWLTMTCAGQLAVFNFSPDPQEIPIPEGEWIPSLFSDGEAHEEKGLVPGHSTRIYSSVASGISRPPHTI